MINYGRNSIHCLTAFSLKEDDDMKHRRLICFLAALILVVCTCGSAFALQASTLSIGSRGEDVRKMQQALIDLGYLKGKADGIFGRQTFQAVCNFQTASRLTADGLAGKKTLAALYSASSGSSGSSSQQQGSSSGSSGSSSQQQGSSSGSSSSSSGSLFGGNYATLRLNDRNDRVKVMQQALIRLNFLSGKADGIFGNQTLNAVLSFQQKNSLTADGLAGKKTLAALEAAVGGGSGSSSSSGSQSSGSSSSSSSSSPSSSLTTTAPDGSKVRLLHWYNDVKPTLRGGQHLLVYDPSTGISWTLRIHSCGRHCDAEPLTAQDTANMVKAFGGQNTWNQKGVFVKLPSGVWTVGSTHDMPHESGTISDNNFNGHLCVHFLRDMAEAKENDPNYGVANQETIRALWKSMTGEVISN